MIEVSTSWREEFSLDEIRGFYSLTPVEIPNGKTEEVKIQILSDLHNEFQEHVPNPAPDADMVVMAGDIGKGQQGLVWAPFAYPGKPVLFVPGNHEYYGRDIAETQALMRLTADETGVHLLDRDEIVIDGVRFLGTTLWTDFRLFGDPSRKDVMAECQKYLNDFRLIHYGRLGHFSPTHAAELFELNLAWLTEKLDEPFAGKTVVITHHLPSLMSVSDRFKDDPCTGAFASNLDHLFGKMDLWIHGHTHDSVDYIVNGTRVICNPRGYWKHELNPCFVPDLVVEV